jgi:hypothetical protein
MCCLRVPLALLYLAESSISERVLEGCQSACQYAVDQLQATFNSISRLFPLICIIAGILIYLLLKGRKNESTQLRAEPARLNLWIIPAAIALGITSLRFTLEKLEVSQTVVDAVGIGWLTLPFAIYFALRVRRWAELFTNLALYALAARIPVAILMILASYLHWGSHYDISSLTHLDTQWGRLNYEANSFRQHLHIIYLAQLVIMPIYGIITGMIAGAGVFLLRKFKTWYLARNLKKVTLEGH